MECLVVDRCQEADGAHEADRQSIIKRLLVRDIRSTLRSLLGHSAFAPATRLPMPRPLGSCPEARLFESPNVPLGLPLPGPLSKSAMDDLSRLVRVSTAERAEDDYFTSTSPPATLQAHEELAADFLCRHSASKRRVVLVTSGGTTVPLENQTVRFIDNFSAGTRGATSAEYFLEAGYAVIFLHRQFSLLPYSRHYSHSTNCFLDFMAEQVDGQVVVGDAYQVSMQAVLRKYTAAKKEKSLLILPFTTITDYLWALRGLATLMKPLGPSALFYLAAAVSDFFIPKDRLAEHKIQSTDFGGDQDERKVQDVQNTRMAAKKLVIDLDPVPKFLKRLVDGWAPDGMIVSFKLETDPSILIGKSRIALERYSHHLVIGNLLSTRKWEVVFVTRDAPERWIRVPLHRRSESMSYPFPNRTETTYITDAKSEGQGKLAHDSPLEIESIIVPEVVKLHDTHMQAMVVVTSLN